MVRLAKDLDLPPDPDSEESHSSEQVEVDWEALE